MGYLSMNWQWKGNLRSLGQIKMRKHRICTQKTKTKTKTHHLHRINWARSSFYCRIFAICPLQMRIANKKPVEKWRSYNKSVCTQPIMQSVWTAPKWLWKWNSSSLSQLCKWSPVCCNAYMRSMEITFDPKIMSNNE